MTMLKSTGTRCIMQASSDLIDGMRNKEQHEGKGNGWACNNHNTCNLSLHLFIMGLRLLHAHLLPLPSCCSLFLMPSITACLHDLYCILFLYFFSIVIPTSFNISMKCFYTLEYF